jgi:hypothetical protein
LVLLKRLEDPRIRSRTATPTAIWATLQRNGIRERSPQ